MSDYAINLLKAIETGEQDQMSNAFADAINSKLTDALDAKRIEVAKAIYGGQEAEEEPEAEEAEEFIQAETGASEEDGTEEV